MAAMPSEEQRQFVAELNQLSKDHSSATFGHPGRLVISKNRRQLAFASSAWTKWPDFGGGDLRTESVEEWRMAKVDTNCGFWLEGQYRYLSALTTYMDALRSLSLDVEVQRELLSDLGFHLVKDFVSEEEEKELLEYWGPSSPVFPFGTDEQISKRRWFNYGPILPRTTSGTTKSTLTVIPARLGEMPPVVLRQRLRERVRALAESLVGVQGHPALSRQFEFDQMYVNYYDSASKANIEFHHDNHTCMLGAIAGVSLMSTCDLQLRPLDPSIVRPPLRVTLPRRSLFFLSGLSRWHLQHAILSMPESRISLTFRSVDRLCTRDPELWEQGWDCLEAEEAENAIWPLVDPEGSELHVLFSTPEEASALAGGERHATGGRVPRRSTVVTAEDKAQQQQQTTTRGGYVAPASMANSARMEPASRSVPREEPLTSSSAPAAAVSYSSSGQKSAYGSSGPCALGGAGSKQGFYPRQRAATAGRLETSAPSVPDPPASGSVEEPGPRLPVRSSYYGGPRVANAS